MSFMDRLVALERAGTLPEMYQMLDPDEKYCVYQLVSGHCYDHYTVREAIIRAATARRYWDVIEPSMHILVGRYLSYDEARWAAAQGRGEREIRRAYDDRIFQAVTWYD